MHRSLLLSTLSCLLCLPHVHALWLPAELHKDGDSWIPEDFSPFVIKRQSTNLNPCGDDFPSDFQCPTDTTCLLLNTTSSLKAVLCCPAGQDCEAIAPVQCDQKLQNATAFPNSQLHADPTAALDACGDACCPMGYSCQNGACIALTKDEASSSSSSVLPSTASALTTSTGAPPTPTATSSEGATITPLSVTGVENDNDDNAFSAKSFVEGFVPGIVLGALLIGALVFCLRRRKKNKQTSYVDEKRYSSGRFTLTDLGPNVSRRPTVHGRSISEPTASLEFCHRTEFLKSSPPRDPQSDGLRGYAVHVHSPAKGPATPAAQIQKSPLIKGWSFSHSPFVNQAQTPIPQQAPLPAHLKRGSITTFIEPVRGLKKQRSQHNLRNPITNGTNRKKSVRRVEQAPPRTSRSGSQETMTVMMDTPAAPRDSPSTLPTAVYRPQDAHKSTHGIIVPAPSETRDASASDSDDSTPIEEQPNEYTPTRPGRNSNSANIGRSLQSPYTPSNHLRPPPVPESNMNSLLPPGMNAPGCRDSAWRNTAMTTFSGIMKQAGFGRNSVQAVKNKKNDDSGFGMGPDPRAWNR